MARDPTKSPGLTIDLNQDYIAKQVPVPAGVVAREGEAASGMYVPEHSQDFRALYIQVAEKEQRLVRGACARPLRYLVQKTKSEATK